MNLDKTKRIFLKAMIGCLVAAALIAVVTILIGHFNDITTKALFTILIIAIHCLVSFGFIVSNEKQETFDSLNFFTNAAFLVIILSFLTAVQGIWGILPAVLVLRLYYAYFVLLFAILHGEVLAKTIGMQHSIDTTVKVNYVFMIIVVLMLMPVIFLADNNVLGSFYYRLLAACGIVDATLTLIAVILHRLYLQKHPEVKDMLFHAQALPVAAYPGQVGVSAPVAVQQPSQGMNIFVKILIGFVALQFIGAIFILFVGTLIFRR